MDIIRWNMIITILAIFTIIASFFIPRMSPISAIEAEETRSDEIDSKEQPFSKPSSVISGSSFASSSSSSSSPLPKSQGIHDKEHPFSEVSESPSPLTPYSDEVQKNHTVILFFFLIGHPVILLSIVGGFFLLLIIVICFCYCRYNRLAPIVPVNPAEVNIEMANIPAQRNNIPMPGYL